jgi:hypothetical protein
MLSERRDEAASRDLLVAANAVQDAAHAGDLAALPDELAGLGEALRAAGRAYESSASRVVPGPRPEDRSICSRYQRAAARWPDSPPPSHERFAAALASLHAAAEAARLAARRCDRARQDVDVLLRPGTPS